MGRREELALVGRAVGAVGASGLVLAGEAGVGKTRLAREALAVAEGRGCVPFWAAATRAGSVVPFGALASLLPGGTGPGMERAGMFAQLRDQVVSAAGGRRPVLAVDDGQWLDRASAGLVHQLVLSGTVFVLVTLRSGVACPDAVTALWKDGLVERLEVQFLAAAETASLVEMVMGGLVDGITQARLWQLCRGNVLYLRELVAGGLDRDELRQVEGVWRWSGTITAAPRLLDLLRDRLGDLPQSQWALLELLAFGEPLDTEVLTRAGATLKTLEAAEAAGVVATEATAGRVVVRLGHPLYGEVVRAQTGALGVQAIHRRLAKALAASVGGNQADGLRMASWRLEAGDPTDAEALLVAAGAAADAGDYGLAERLARAALAAGGGAKAERLLVGTLVGQGRAEEAEDMLVAAAARATTDRERASLAGARAMNLAWGLNRAAEAEEVLARSEASITDPAVRDELVAQRAKLLLYAGRPVEALRAVDGVVHRPGAGEGAVLESLVTAAQALCTLGRHDQALAAVERGEGIADRAVVEVWSHAKMELAGARASAYLWAGQLTEATELAVTSYHQVVRAGLPLDTAVWAGWLGEAACSRGAMRTALRWMREAAALAQGSDHPYRAFVRRALFNSLGRIAALAGDAALAETALREVDRLGVGSLRFFDTWAGPSRAWLAAAHGELTAAVEAAWQTAEQARDHCQTEFELVSLHDVARLGAPERVAGRLAEVAACVEGSMAPLYAAHVAALMAGDGFALDAVAEDFASLGTNLLAAEVAAEAASAHRRAGRNASAAASAASARARAATCEGARTPALARLDAPPELTRRETEVAQLATAGMSSRDIASRLVISVRTVDNTLGGVYAKLGVAGRRELVAILGHAVGAPSPEGE